MHTRIRFTLIALIVAAVLLAGCGGQAEVIKTVEVTVVAQEIEVVTEVEAIEVTLAPQPINAASESLSGERALASPALRPNRLIIKNAELALLVTDTDIAIDRTTQIAADYGGYVISSRTWHEQWYTENYKHATITLAAPVDQFEQVMRRLRGLALHVTDENISGQDVTDEYVDLESRLGNLEATRDRIREFLEQAQDVEEALKVNQELTAVEGQIEQVQGRMNYLFDRASYSTIIVQVDPELPADAPTPTPTPRPSWQPRQTIEQAEYTLGSILRAFADSAIWLAIVVAPLAGPPALLAWGMLRWTKRRGRQ